MQPMINKNAQVSFYKIAKGIFKMEVFGPSYLENEDMQHICIILCGGDLDKMIIDIDKAIASEIGDSVS